MMELPYGPESDLTKIALYMEENMMQMIEKANEKIEGIDNRVTTIANEADLLRDRVWEDYHKMRSDRVCSRCGNYCKYEIIEKIIPTARELNERYGHNFHIKHYELKSTTVMNKNSLDREWGSICNKCRDHILGIKPFPLSSSRLKAEQDLVSLKKTERLRLLYQEDEIRDARARVNKSRRDGTSNSKSNEKPIANPNDLREQVQREK